jgi:hypothetical protein
MKNINFACLALMALSLPFPAIAANEVFALPFSVAAKGQARQPYPNMCFPNGASPQAKKYRQTKLLERAQRYGYPGGRSRLLSLLLSGSQKHQGKKPSAPGAGFLHLFM